MPKAQVGDIEIYYEEHGQGEPLVLIMGLGATTLGWASQIPTFSREYRVVAFDNRGAGRSDKPAMRYTIPMFADDTAGLMDALSIASAHVYGQSMGGLIAQELALRHPHRVQTLMLGSTLCGGRNSVAPSTENVARLASLNSLSPEQAAESALTLLYSEEFAAREHDALIERSLLEAELRPPPEAWSRQALAATHHSTYDRLPQIACPTLIITGDDDKIVPPENSHILAERIPGASLVTLPKAGHGYLVECAEESNAIVLDFIRRHAMTGARAGGGGPPK